MQIYCRVLLLRASGYYFSQFLISVCCIYLCCRINKPQTCRHWVWRPAPFQILSKSAVVAPGMETSEVQRSCTEPPWGSRARINNCYRPKAACCKNTLNLLFFPLSIVSQPPTILDDNIIIYPIYELYYY